MGDRDHRIAGPHAGSHQSKPECIGATGDANAVFGAAVVGKLALERLYLGAANELRGTDRLTKRLYELFLELAMWGHQVDERYWLCSHDV
jgi:hypothetical protein